MFLSPLQILSHLELPPNPRVGDFGTGKGEYALALARRVGNGGTVYAFDAFEPSLDSLKREVEPLGSQVFPLRADLNTHIPLKSQLLHAAVVANTLHQLSDRASFVRELARVMDARGKVLVVDWLGSFKNMGPPQERVLEPAETATLFRQAGFETGDMLPAGTHHFAFIASK